MGKTGAGCDGSRPTSPTFRPFSSDRRQTARATLVQGDPLHPLSDGPDPPAALDPRSPRRPDRRMDEPVRRPPAPLHDRDRVRVVRRAQAGPRAEPGRGPRPQHGLLREPGRLLPDPRRLGSAHRRSPPVPADGPRGPLPAGAPDARHVPPVRRAPGGLL